MPGLQQGLKLIVLAFADGILTFSFYLTILTEALINKTKEIGLEISEEQTKYFVVRRNKEQEDSEPVAG